MKDVLGIIYTTKEDVAMGKLTEMRAAAALPVVGRYRMIDFMLSNMVNSGIRNIGIIVQKNYHSLMGHLGSGQEWNLHTKSDGLLVMPPFTRGNKGDYNGTLGALQSNLEFLSTNIDQEYVLLTSGYGAFTTTYNAMLKQHKETNADVTVMYINDYKDDIPLDKNTTPHTYFDVGEDGTIRDIQIGASDPGYRGFSMSVMIFNRERLIRLLDYARSHNMREMHQDLLKYCIESNQHKVMGFEYKDYYRCVECIAGYFQFNMDMLDSDLRRVMFKNFVYTRVQDEVPVKYGDHAVCQNSLVADGCIIEGTVINSIIGRGVRIYPGAVVKNSVIMQQCRIYEGVELNYVILDKLVAVRGHNLSGVKELPYVAPKGARFLD